MKKLALFSILIILVTVGFFQDKEKIAVLSKSLIQKKSLDKNQTFFLQETYIDSSIFFQNTILLYKNRTNIQDSKLELYDDSNFLLEYNINLETVDKTDYDTGEQIQLTTLISDKIGGKYDMIQKQNSKREGSAEESLRFILKNDCMYDFKVLQKDNQILLIKNSLN